ncbi:unnamed protein product [marine sediment metagenome]|uniref:Uncharacterized protein n=1 Tax=marine sediment metagenome TaxID=412755 RepID=X1L4D8_9ZZZZ
MKDKTKEQLIAEIELLRKEVNELRQGYRVVYVGNGDSDILPAKYAHLILARGALLAYCRKNNLKYKSFDDFPDVVKVLKLL